MTPRKRRPRSVIEPFVLILSPFAPHLAEELWARLGWGLAAPDQAPLLEEMMPNVADANLRRQRALTLQSKILARTNAFMQAMDRPATPPPGLEMFLVAGDGHQTPMTASVDSATGAVSILATGEGDGTVLRTSALLDERLGAEWQPQVVTPLRFHWTMFLPQEHVDLTNSIEFRDNVLFWLLEDPRYTLYRG